VAIGHHHRELGFCPLSGALSRATPGSPHAALLVAPLGHEHELAIEVDDADAPQTLVRRALASAIMWK